MIISRTLHMQTQNAAQLCHRPCFYRLCNPRILRNLRHPKFLIDLVTEKDRLRPSELLLLRQSGFLATSGSRCPPPPSPAFHTRFMRPPLLLFSTPFALSAHALTLPSLSDSQLYYPSPLVLLLLLRCPRYSSRNGEAGRWLSNLNPQTHQ